MSDLPTRDELREVNIDKILFSGEYDATEAVSKVFAVAVAYLEGDIVARNAIDYEAMGTVFQRQRGQAPWDTLDDYAKQDVKIDLDELLDAALGGVDE